MTKEQLQSRIDQLQREMVASSAAYNGAIQDCNYWLQQLEEVPPSPPTETNSEESK